MRHFLIIIFLFLFFNPFFVNAEEHLIDSIPFFPATDYQCGPASLAMVFNYLGLKISVEEISKDILSKEGRGTVDFDMILYPQKKDFNSFQYRGSLEDLKEKIKQNKPLIVMVDEGFWFYKKYHYMVVVGFNDAHVIVNSGEDRNKKIEVEKFIKKWQKADYWTLLIEKKT